MTAKEIIKMPIVIIAGSLLLIGGVIALGFHFGGWFGGSDAWKAKNPEKAKPNTDPNAPNACDPDRVGYLKNGVKNTDCGQVPCHPYKDGYDEQGFPDVNCEKSRMQNPQGRTTGNGGTGIGGGGITLPSNYAPCDKQLWEDKKSGITFSFAMSTSMGICNPYYVIDAMNFIRNYLSSRAGLWDINKINEQIVPLQKLLQTKSYPNDLRLQMVWNKI